MELDLKGVAQGVIKNNMGVGRIELRVRGAVANGTATFAQTGQKLPIVGAPAASSKPWLVVDVLGWKAGDPLLLDWKGEQNGPTSAAEPATRPIDGGNVRR